jgi:hypothetical protein
MLGEFAPWDIVVIGEAARQHDLCGCATQQFGSDRFLSSQPRPGRLQRERRDRQLRTRPRLSTTFCANLVAEYVLVLSRSTSTVVNLVLRREDEG